MVKITQFQASMLVTQKSVTYLTALEFHEKVILAYFGGYVVVWGDTKLKANIPF